MPRRNLLPRISMSALAVSCSLAVLPRVAAAQELKPTLEIMAGLGTPVGYGGLLVGASYGEHLSAAAGVGATQNGPQLGLRIDGYPLAFRRWSFGVRGSFSVGRYVTDNCGPIYPCGETFHTERRWEMKWTPAAFAGLAAVARFRASDSVSLTWHLGVSHLLNYASGTCTFEDAADACESGSRFAHNFVYADLGMALTWDLEAWSRD